MAGRKQKKVPRRSASTSIDNRIKINNNERMYKNRLWILPYSVLTLILTVLASGIGGRALWCDEICRIFAQRMTVSQLLAFENIRLFETQTPVGYLFMRPIQILLGMETGAFVCISLCAAIIVSATLITFEHVFGKRPPVAIALLIAINPFLIYHGSELSIYTLWAAAAALIMMLLIVHWESPRLRDTILLGIVATFFISVQFAGMFIWLGISSAVFLGTWMDFGLKKSIRRIPVLVIPAAINLPMYMAAKNVPQHLSFVTPMEWTWARLGTIFSQLSNYIVTLLPSLTGGSWLGCSLLVIGIFYLIYANRRHRYVGLIAAVMVASITLFVGYTLMRNYSILAGRYWIYASAPAQFLVAAGLYAFLNAPTYSQGFRRIGWCLTLILVVLNMIATGAVLSQEGRQAPYKKLQAYLQSLKPDRTVISVNYYENRFLGHYYPIPNNGTRISPAAWEEGAEARIRGVKKIQKLVPDAIGFVSGNDLKPEYERAGFPLNTGFVYRWSRLLKIATQLHIFPEPASELYPFALYHETREALSSIANTNGVPVSLPVSGFKAASFRNPQGELFFGLMSPSQLVLDVYIPSNNVLKSSELKLSAISYRTTQLHVTRDAQTVCLQSLNNSSTDAQGFYIPQKKQFKGLPNPDYLVEDGMQFVLVMNPQNLTIPLGRLSSGWHTITLNTAQNTPWMILAHACVPGEK